MGTEEGDIVLDYHLGSGTTAAVAHKMGRQYIGVEQMDYIETISVERMKKVIEGEQGGISKSVEWKGEGEFVYMELMEANQKYLDKISAAKDTKTLLALYKEMQESGFINYYVDIKTIDENISDFKDLSLENQKKFLAELLDKNLLYVNHSEIEDESYGVSDEEKKLNREFYK
ncbi:site-specific DNA-methyltransferase [Candidatus Gracilibacteria bacterium]|nr:site-specific DNA-methyltransferase [Candidatus Gracilibacteria bacterium]